MGRRRFEVRVLKRVVFPQHPRSDESLIGFLSRTAEWNILEAPSDLLDGIGSANCKLLSLHQRADLAHTVGSRPSQIEAAFERTFGTGLSPHYLSYTARRASPAFLDRYNHARAAWHVKPLTFCSRSWEMLIDDCPSCRTPLRWDDCPMSRCRRCDFLLSTATTTKVPKALRSTLAKAEALALPSGQSVRDVLGEVHCSIANLTPAEAFDVAVQFGWALAAPIAGQSRRTMVGLDPRDMAAGVRMLKGYPNTINAMVGDQHNRSEEPFFRRISAVATDRAGPVADIMGHVAGLRTEHRGVGRLKRARVGQNLMTLTQLADELKLERALVKRMVDQKVFGPIPTRGTLRSYGWFSQRDLERGKAFRDSRVGARHWCRQVGLRHVHVRQLLALGLISEPEPGAGRFVFDTLQLSSESVAHLRSSLDEVTCYSIVNRSDWVRLSHALRVIGGVHKPVAAILRAALSGALPEGLRGDRSAPLLQDLFIHRSVANDIALRARMRAPQLYSMGKADFGAYWPKFMDRAEVEELLNCYPFEFSAARAEGFLPVADGFQTAVETSRVLEFAASHVSTSEIAQLVGLGPKAVRCEMNSLGFARSVGGFWNRKDVHGPDGLLASLEPRRILAVWDGPQFGLPLQAEPAFRDLQIFDTDEFSRFRSRSKMLFGAG